MRIEDVHIGLAQPMTTRQTCPLCETSFFVGGLTGLVLVEGIEGWRPICGSCFEEHGGPLGRLNEILGFLTEAIRPGIRQTMENIVEKARADAWPDDFFGERHPADLHIGEQVAEEPERKCE